MSEIDQSTTEPVGAAKWTAKHDATTKVAMDIIEKERAAQDAKTARLRANRLANAKGQGADGGQD